MTAAEILNEIRRLPLGEKKSVLKTLENELQSQNELSDEEQKEHEVDQILIARGLMREIPAGITDEDEHFEPIKTSGKPLSEVIVEERR